MTENKETLLPCQFETEFHSWWKASKYSQVVSPAKGWEQIAKDGFNAAIEFMTNFRAQSPQPQDADRAEALDDAEILYSQGCSSCSDHGDEEIERAYKNIRAILSTDQYALGFEAGKKSRDQEVKELVGFIQDASLWLSPFEVPANIIARLETLITKHNKKEI